MPYAVAAVVAVGVSVDQQRKAQEAAEQGQAFEQKLQDVKANKERRRQFRAARKAQAELTAQSVATGTQRTSKTTAQQGNVQSNLSENISFINQSQSLTKSIGESNVKAAKHQSLSATAGALGNFAVSAKGSGLFDQADTADV